MKEYRKSVDLDPDLDYTYVELGPVDGRPAWHPQAHPSRWPFPTPEAAQRFADGVRAEYPGREVVVR
ncbi:hypothetical protein CH25_gp29 [Mycobacterium phage EagleEye]|uniref:Uncharacterized protein n=1 Tax=Mycobacterium phage EagleEye TaxID=1429759 RepID=W0LN32_9CAUD|nr:hypothetical protein CH25_gp29 [Mycobacterium phage EagleEye]AHG23857.1 hypothetical protein PBI_EAGLEEYE_77 [Mycobacterium phage EagleEye]QDK03510.1 hypothetical protein SEA_LUCYEDI_76 [Mycobacterium phage Lucyedi]QNJ55856.1 hypothetical protein SEA_PAINTERBOY_75 [Mycobacterium phage PainterBoy]